MHPKNAIYFDGARSEKNVNLAKSYALWDAIQAQNYMCWYNNIRGIDYLDDPKALYVEGYAVYLDDDQLGLWHHSWIEQDGEIIDTLPCADNEATVYFAGVKYSRNEVLTLYQGMRPPFSENLKRRKYSTAYRIAMRFYKRTANNLLRTGGWTTKIGISRDRESSPRN